VQLVGFDIMLTAGGWPFLIECNANPLIAAQNPWHGLLVARMMDDYVTLAADQPFFGGRAAPPQPRPPLDGAHVAEFEGSGFVLLVGRPTEAHPTPLLPLVAHDGLLLVQRSDEERRRCEVEGGAAVPAAAATEAPAAAASRGKADADSVPAGTSRHRSRTAEAEAPSPAADARPRQRPSTPPVGMTGRLRPAACSLDGQCAELDTNACTAREPTESGANRRTGDGGSSARSLGGQAAVAGRRTPVRRRHPSPALSNTRLGQARGADFAGAVLR